MTKRTTRPDARKERRGARPRNDEGLHRLLGEAQLIAETSTKARKEPVKALNDAQRRYDAAMRSSDIVFGIGPAGTGKTWLAAMRAAEAMRAKTIEKIYVTRPAVEAGESLGFLPGELEEKYEPYFRPVRDALEEGLGKSHLEFLLRSGAIEARPLALLRGATFKNCWVLLDEAQNTTPSQMKMFLTRIGENAKLIVNGDPKQKDIPGESGLVDAARRFDNTPGIEFVHFRRADIVRSGLCQVIVEGYEN